MRLELKLSLISVIVIASITLISCGGSSNSASAANQWTWVGGANWKQSVTQGATLPPVYGTNDMPSPNNTPGARTGANSWTDTQGNFWLFGGGSSFIHQAVSAPPTVRNDLWKYSNGQWTWIGGTRDTNQSGIYGTLSIPSIANIPGGRTGAVTWTDAQGAVWLFGGYGYGSFQSNAGSGYLNDLWKYSNGQWAWVGGMNTVNLAGSYGVMGQPSAANLPTPRCSATTWADSSGNFWIFGGYGLDANGNSGFLGDLWKYSNGMWTWMAGPNTSNTGAVYGQQGVPSAANSPGERAAAASWSDAKGNLWLFGGFAAHVGSLGPQGLGDLNDLWEYSNGEWTWISGSNQGDQSGSFGTQGTPSPGNIPGARDSAVFWTDTQGNFWLLGGVVDVTSLNDLWKYSNGQWTWIGGSQQVAAPGNYAARGTASASNFPGSRFGASSWVNKSGNLWLYGGDAFIIIPGGGGTNFEVATLFGLNDLWKYTP